MLTIFALGSVAPAQSLPPATAAAASAELPVPAGTATVQDLAKTELKGTGAYRLGSGDKVRVTVFNEETLSGEYEVDGTGAISLQLIGSMNVVGRTVPEVIASIQKALRDGGYMLNPSVAMEVLNYRPFYVIGEIKEPGKYAYVSDMTVLNAVALAGGYTYRAKKDKVLIVRASDPERKEQTAKPGDQVLPGDIIRVPERFF